MFAPLFLHISSWLIAMISATVKLCACSTITDAQKLNTLVPIISPATKEGGYIEGTIGTEADCFFYASLLEDGVTLTHTFARNNASGTAPAPLRRGYIHVPIMKDTAASLTINGDTKLGPGDGLFIDNVEAVAITAATAGGPGSGQAVEFVLFDLK